MRGHGVLLLYGFLAVSRQCGGGVLMFGMLRAKPLPQRTQGVHGGKAHRGSLHCAAGLCGGNCVKLFVQLTALLSCSFPKNMWAIWPAKFPKNWWRAVWLRPRRCPLFVRR